jgi:hypothetical protein
MRIVRNNSSSSVYGLGLDRISNEQPFSEPRKCDLQGWVVVGGNGGTTYDALKPVIMFTPDGGKTWENKLKNSGIDFPTGEWGWEIQFLTPQIGFVSLENDTAAAILKTIDGGESWKRIQIADPQRNVELEGIGFINERVGWVGGWGHGFTSGSPDGTTSGTTDCGETWFDANGVGRFINRFRFTKTEPIVAYASGRTIYQCTVADGAALATFAAAPRIVEPPIAKAWERLDITTKVPQDANQLTITVFDPRQTLVKVLTEENPPQPGARAFSWNFKTDDGVDAGTGHFIYRISIDGQATTGMAVRPARAAPDALGLQVAELIERFAPRAKRAHDDLVLPDTNAKPNSLKSLLDKPLDLMAALVRGGWVIPGESDRSMLLVAIMGTGPMQGVMAQVDIQLLSDWITAGRESRRRWASDVRSSRLLHRLWATSSRRQACETSVVLRLRKVKTKSQKEIRVRSSWEARMALGDGIRRNIADVSPAERQRLRDAFFKLNKKLYPGNPTDTQFGQPVPGGLTYWFKQDEIHARTGVHSQPVFLPWHREFCRRLEQGLRVVDAEL